MTADRAFSSLLVRANNSLEYRYDPGENRLLIVSLRTEHVNKSEDFTSTADFVVVNSLLPVVLVASLLPLHVSRTRTSVRTSSTGRSGCDPTFETKDRAPERL